MLSHLGDIWWYLFLQSLVSSLLLVKNAMLLPNRLWGGWPIEREHARDTSMLDLGFLLQTVTLAKVQPRMLPKEFHLEVK